MIETTKEFTEEAIQVFESYLSGVRTALEETELDEAEISSSIDELRFHIVSQCELRAKGNIVTTDLVRTSIKKLGDPKSIAESLQSELDFADEVDMAPVRSRARQPEPESIEIRAKHISALYATLCWLMTAVAIFVSYSAEFSNLAWLYPMLYLTSVGTLIATRNLDAYMYNSHLQQHVKPNIHTSILPAIYGILTYSNLVHLPLDDVWTVPAILVLFLILGSTSYGREYYIETFQLIRDIIEDNPRKHRRSTGSGNSSSSNRSKRSAQKAEKPAK